MVDWYPTLLGLAGASLAQPHALDGRDAWATIARGAPSPHDAILLNATRRGGAVRAGSWKLVVTKPRKQLKLSDRVELFDLSRDPNEQVDLAAAHPEKVAELRARFDAWAGEAVAPERSRDPASFQPPAVWGETE